MEIESSLHQVAGDLERLIRFHGTSVEREESLKMVQSATLTIEEAKSWLKQ